MEKIFLFDINGVILESVDIKLMYDEMKCTCTYEEFKSISTASKLYYDHESGFIGTDRYIELLKEYTGSKITKEDYIKLHYRAKSKYSEQAKKLMKHLKSKGYKLGIISNLKKMDAEYFFKTFDTDQFDYEFYSCFIHSMKPDDKIFEEVARVTKPLENEVYFFDDVLENCKKAREYGIKAINTTSNNIIENYKKYTKDDEIWKKII